MAFRSKSLKANVWKTDMMISGDMRNECSPSKVFPRMSCGLRVKAKSILCANCGKWNYTRCPTCLHTWEKYTFLHKNHLYLYNINNTIK